MASILHITPQAVFSSSSNFQWLPLRFIHLNPYGFGKLYPQRSDLRLNEKVLGAHCLFSNECGRCHGSQAWAYWITRQIPVLQLSGLMWSGSIALRKAGRVGSWQCSPPSLAAACAACASARCDVAAGIGRCPNQPQRGTGVLRQHQPRWMEFWSCRAPEMQKEKKMLRCVIQEKPTEVAYTFLIFDWTPPYNNSTFWDSGVIVFLSSSPSLCVYWSPGNSEKSKELSWFETICTSTVLCTGDFSSTALPSPPPADDCFSVSPISVLFAFVVVFPYLQSNL